MKKPSKPFDEKERLDNLRSYELLDTESEPDFDEITELIGLICNCPIALISLVDQNRQWFKAKIGLTANETDRDISFCGHAILQTGIFEIEDARTDHRFSDNPLVVNEPYVIFYAGCPIITVEKKAVGTLCVIDHKPRKLDEKQKRSLVILANQVGRQMYLRKQNKTLQTLYTSMFSDG